MNKKYAIVIMLLAFVIMFSCKKEDENEVEVYGTVTVEMTAARDIVRKQEALLGNMTADAWMFYVQDYLKKTADFALPNGGNLRFNEETRPEAIYPAGDYDSLTLAEIFFYDNSIVLVDVTGYQLKQVLERSVSVLPDQAKGWFLQCSKEISYTADLSKQAQILDETDPNNPFIVTEGERITSIKVNGVEVDSATVYTMVSTDYMCAGNDGFVTLKTIDKSLKDSIGDYREPFRYYLKEKSPVTPTLSGRIVID